MGILVLHGKVAVKRLTKEKSDGGILLPEMSKETSTAEIVAIGDVQSGLKTGMKVVIGPWEGIKVKIDGDELLLLKEKDIYAVIE